MGVFSVNIDCGIVNDVIIVLVKPTPDVTYVVGERNVCHQLMIRQS